VTRQTTPYSAVELSGLFAIGDHLKRLSETSDPLETLGRIIDFEAFRPVLDAGMSYSDAPPVTGRPCSRC
jgi:hypothetical protein